MLLLNPQSVKFGAAVWLDVTAVIVDRDTERAAVEWSDLGPHVVYADAPEQRITVRVTRRLVRDTIASPRPGDSAELVAYAAPTAGDAQRRRIRATCAPRRPRPASRRARRRS